MEVNISTMSANPIYFAADAPANNVVHVAWSNSPSRPNGAVFVVFPNHIKVPLALLPAIAELTAIKFLVDTRQLGTSIRAHDVYVTQESIKALMEKQAEESPLIPWGKQLYLYVGEGKLKVPDEGWVKDAETDIERISVVNAEEVTWPKAACRVMKTEVGISRHAVERFIERCGIKADFWHAYQALAKWVDAKGTRIVPHDEVRKTNPGMRLTKNTVVLHHQTTDTALIVMKEPRGYVLVTVHSQYQEFVPTFVRGRVEYRRNT